MERIVKKSPFEYKTWAIRSNVVPEIITGALKLEVKKSSLDKYDFYIFEIDRNTFVITYFKELDSWSISTGDRIFSSLFDGAHLSDDEKVLRFFTINENRGYNYTSALFLRNLIKKGGIYEN